MGIEVCDLRRKFQLLKTYGCIASLKDIADEVGRAEKTLWGWADGTATTLPNQVPQRNFEKFQTAFIETMKDRVSPERAAELLLAPASHLETVLRRSQATSLMDLIEAEADTTAIKLIRLEDNEKRERGLIETQLDQAPTGPVYQIKQGEWFRLAIKKDLSRANIIALQNGGGLWGQVLWHIEAATGHLLLPGIQADGSPAFMRERNTLGQTALATLADFVRQQPKTGRELSSISLTVE